MRWQKLAVCLAVMTAGCAPADPHAPDPDRVARRVTSPDGDIGVVVSGNDAFAWSLYGELVDGDANLFFSPLSISAALGMTYAGAAGTTATEMASTLHVALDDDRWHAAFGELLDDLNGDKARGYRLEVANRLFGEEGYACKAPFLERCETDWRAPLQEVPWSTDPEAGRQMVNDWVAESTQERIPELFPAGSLSSDTRLVLANAIYFLADWWTQFDVQDTSPAPFTRLDGTVVQVDMMRLDTEGNDDARVRVAQVDGATVVRLPYEDDEVSAYVVLPTALDGLPALEAGLDAATFEGWVTDLAVPGEGGDELVLALPKLELRWKASLKPALVALGMGSAFDPLTADLTAMAEPEGDGPLRVFDVVHEAWIRMDEQGTEAAAATGVVVGTDSAPEPVVVDHPYLLVIRDDLTGSLLFIARVTDPRPSE